MGYKGDKILSVGVYLKVFRIEVKDDYGTWKGYFTSHAQDFYSLLYDNKDINEYCKIKKDLEVLHEPPASDFNIKRVSQIKNKKFAFTELAMDGEIGSVICTRLIYYLEKYPEWIRLIEFEVDEFDMSYSGLQIMFKEEVI